MFKINNIEKANGNYAEESQPNPIRWLLLHRTGEKEFEPQGYWLKCKDFFNDYAYSYQTRKGFSIYGFNAGAMKIPEQGQPVFMAVKFLTPHFQHNMEVLNNWLVAQGVPPVPLDIDGDLALLGFDPFYFQNTYNISLISLIIRLMNYEKKFPTFKEALECTAFAPKDQAKWSEIVKKDAFFKVPDKLKKFIWYYSEQQNSEKTEHTHYGLSSYVHNCGVLAWSKAF